MTTIAALQSAALISRGESQLLLQHYLGCDHAWLIAHAEEPLTAHQLEDLKVLFARRHRGEPIAYLTGQREFWGLTLRVSPAVLIPRPDTETLVEWALQLIDRSSMDRVMDVGTGSGAIALALKSARGDLAVSATDISESALAIARENSLRLGLPIAFSIRHWLNQMTPSYWPLIVSNPPYIAEGDEHLGQGDLPHEPRGALASGPDGLDGIRELVSQAPDVLADNGWLLLEHGFDQGPKVRQLFLGRGFTDIETRRDLSGHERVTGGRWRVG